MDIRCRKNHCKYNDRFTCKAKAILVDKKIVCSTFENDADKKVQDVTKHLFEREPDFAPQMDRKALEIKCKAPCLFNRNGICVSNGITLNSIQEKPYCVSFLKK